jgi:hypothetical protein
MHNQPDDLFDTHTYNALCVTLCTDDTKYTDLDSHYIHIPKLLFAQYANKLNLYNTCFELSNPDDPEGKKVYLKKIEPSPAQFESNILVPDWVCKKLSLKMCGGNINVSPIIEPIKIKRCKIRGSDSIYVKLDIKTLLENKINEFKCVNLGSFFSIGEVKFTIVELISTKNKPVDYGVLNNELEIDFDTPDDIKVIEKRKEIMDKIINMIETKVNGIIEKQNKLNQKKTGVFKFSDFIEYKTEQENLRYAQAIDWDEINNLMTLDLEKKFKSKPQELKENIQILKELIEEGKKNQAKMAEEYKKNNTSDTVNSASKIQKTSFDTKAYKLNDSDYDNSVKEQTLKLSKEEIRKARLEKFK